MRQITTVLVGTSLSDASDALVGDALALARRTGARLHVAHASFLAPPFVAEPFPPWIDEESAAAAAEQARRRVEAQLARVGIDRARELDGVTVAPGAVHQVLLDAAAACGADLLVIGSETSRAAAGLLGSTADRLLPKATRPVLIVHGRLAVPPRKVLAPVDLSPFSADAFRCGMELLAALGGGEPPPRVEALLVLLRHDWLRVEILPQEARALASDSLRRFAAQHAGPLAGTVWISLRAGHPGVEIVRELADWPADLVVLGTHGRSGLERFLLGGTATYVTHHAPCSVLVVPPEAALRSALQAEREQLAVPPPTAAASAPTLA